jgi:hypothetical protein
MRVATSALVGTALAQQNRHRATNEAGSVKKTFLEVGHAFVVYLALAKDSPNCPPPRHFADYLGVLKIGDRWWSPLGVARL